MNRSVLITEGREPDTQCWRSDGRLQRHRTIPAKMSTPGKFPFTRRGGIRSRSKSFPPIQQGFKCIFTREDEPWVMISAENSPLQGFKYGNYQSGLEKRVIQISFQSVSQIKWKLKRSATVVFLSSVIYETISQCILLEAGIFFFFCFERRMVKAENIKYKIKKFKGVFLPLGIEYGS